jgi:hypothetical protein
MEVVMLEFTGQEDTSTAGDRIRQRDAELVPYDSICSSQKIPREYREKIVPTDN